MSQESRIEVINRDGWRKEYPLQKGIIYIGSAPSNDIILGETHGSGVAALHAQLIASAGSDTPYKLVNLSDSEIALGPGGNNVVPPRAVVGLPDGTSLRLGEFTLVFREGGGSYGGFNNGSGSRNIGLRLSLPSTQLAPNQTLEGKATIRNLGGKTGAHFEVDLEGMDEDCFEIEPGPLLSSGAEKDISFRIYHRGVKPLAGEWTFVIRATAPNAYPGEQAEVFQHLNVLPLYRQQLQLLPGKDIRVTSPRRPSEAGSSTSRTDSSRKGEKTEPPPEPQEEWWDSAEETAASPTVQAQEVRRLKAKVVVTEEVEQVKVVSGTGPASAEVVSAVASSETSEEWAVKVETRPVAPVSPVPPLKPAVPEAEAEKDEVIEVEARPLPAVEEAPPPAAIVEPEVEQFPAVEPAPTVETHEVRPLQASELPPEQFSSEPSSSTGWLGRMKQLWPFSSRTAERESPPATREVDQPYSRPEAVPISDPQVEQVGVAVPEVDLPDAPVVTEETFEEAQVEAVPAESIPEREAVEMAKAPVEMAMPEEEANFYPDPEAAEFQEEEEAGRPAGTDEVKEDWWLDEAEPVTVAESPAQDEDTEEAPETQAAEETSEEEPDDWWLEVSPQQRSITEEQIIRLKAAPPPETEPAAEEKPAEAEVWWTADMEASSSEQSNKKP